MGVESEGEEERVELDEAELDVLEHEAAGGDAEMDEDDGAPLASDDDGDDDDGGAGPDGADGEVRACRPPAA